MTDTTAAVAAAMSVEQALHLAKWSKVHERTLPTGHVHDALHVLAGEVERLTRLHEARPPYRMADWSPADLAALLLRDRAIWVQMTHAANQSETGFGGLDDTHPAPAGRGVG